MTKSIAPDLTLALKRPQPRELDAAQRQEVAAWIEANSVNFPDAVRVFLDIHKSYLGAAGDPRKALEAAVRELRRALHITPSSEKRRTSGAPLSGLPSKPDTGQLQRALEETLERSNRLSGWHGTLKCQHDDRAQRIGEKLAAMSHEKKEEAPEIPPLSDFPVSAEAQAEIAKESEQFVGNLSRGEPEPALVSADETLMRSCGVEIDERQETLPAELPQGLSEADVVKTLHEPRVRYDISMKVTAITLDVEKKVVVDPVSGERRVIAPSTSEFGPPRQAVTWEALATVAVLVCQFAIPFHRLGTMLSSAKKKFTVATLSRMLHYVAERFVSVYLELAKELANAEILAADDTSCRVIEVSKHFGSSSSKPESPPWADYRTHESAERSFLRAEKLREQRIRRREEGDRTARPTPEESPTLGVLIGRELGFESPRKNGDGPKESLHVSVVSGRSVADDPKSLIVFYRSHLGSCGNLFETLLRRREKERNKITLQGDMSASNLVTDPELRQRFQIRTVGCLSHARRPFALYVDEDPVYCEYMLHLMLGLFMHEQRLDEHGRNRENVLAVRKHHSRKLWEDILALAQKVAKKWSKATNLGTAARYIIRHYEALTAYLDDPRLEPTNNHRERMLRMEKLIEGSSMFRKSLEGRFVLDVVRTILQTAVAAGVQPREYLVSVLRADEDEIKAHPERFTPRAWAAAKAAALHTPDAAKQT